MIGLQVEAILIAAVSAESKAPEFYVDARTTKEIKVVEVIVRFIVTFYSISLRAMKEPLFCCRWHYFRTVYSAKVTTYIPRCCAVRNPVLKTSH